LLDFVVFDKLIFTILLNLLDSVVFDKLISTILLNLLDSAVFDKLIFTILLNLLDSVVFRVEFLALGRVRALPLLQPVASFDWGRFGGALGKAEPLVGSHPVEIK
jgi:hypothetical protein